MSKRTLGGGRILGSSRSLSPASAVHHKRPSLLSVSESSASFESQVSTSQTSTETPSQGFSLPVENGGPKAAAAAEVPGPKLECPICNEDMLTLSQLNRHLDDNHQSLEEVEQDEVKTWFKKQMGKAKKFQPLAVLNQKIKGLDVFEPNEIQSPLGTPLHGAPTAESPVPDPDEVITKTHWQKPRYNDLCAEQTCGKPLGSTNGSINCRKCGYIFCEEHTMYQMKLSRSAQHESVRGFWCRVCETCYKSREGYNDYGLTQDHTDQFMSLRRKTVDKTFLEVSRLEKRLTKLTQLLASQMAEQGANGGGLLWSITGKNQRKALEQSVVTWEEDDKVSRCPFCQQEFSSYHFRRHHCRICGRVVCGDARTHCSTEVGLDVTAKISEKASTGVRVDVRMCKDCNKTLFGRRDFAEEVAQRPADDRAYETLVEFEKGIRLMLPKFQRLLLALQNPNETPSTAQLTEASKIRKRLMDAFSKYDVAARRIRDLPSDSPTQQALQKAIYRQSTNFLHLHMLPLKTLPKLLKHASPNGLTGHLTPSSRSTSALSSIKYNNIDGASQVSSSSAVSALEAEEKQLRERLIVLEEQKFFVGEMIADASRRRKFDEVSSLAQNVEDLNQEIDQITKKIGQLDFASIYEQASPTPPGIR